MDWYASAPDKMANSEVHMDNGMVFTLHTNAYALNRFTHQYVSDLTNELPTANGYTAGGVAAGAVTRTLTVANSWSVARANTTAYAKGDVVRPATPNGFLYVATTAGTTGGVVPTFPTVYGQTVADGGVTWSCYAAAVTVFLATNQPTWAGATFTARYLVLSERTPALATAQALIAVFDFGSDKTGLGGTFTVAPHPQLGQMHVPIL